MNKDYYITFSYFICDNCSFNITRIDNILFMKVRKSQTSSVDTFQTATVLKLTSNNKSKSLSCRKPEKSGLGVLTVVPSDLYRSKSCFYETLLSVQDWEMKMKGL